MSSVIKGRNITSSRSKPDGTLNWTCRWKKSRDIWRKEHRNTTFCVQTICQGGNDTEGTACTYMITNDQSYLQECMKFNPTKCKGQAGYSDCFTQVFFLGIVEHLDGLFFAQRKKTYIKEMCFSFYWNTHIRNNALGKFNKDWTSSTVDTKIPLCWGSLKTNLCF